MYEIDSEQDFATSKNFQTHKKIPSFKNSFFDFESLDKLKKDPTRNPEEKRRQRYLIESEIDQFPTLESTTKYLINIIVKLRLENKKFKMIKENLSKFYFRYKDEVKKFNSFQNYQQDGKNSEEGNQRYTEIIENLERRIHMVVIEKEEMGKRYQESFKKIQKLEKKNFHLKEKIYELSNKEKAQVHSLGTSDSGNSPLERGQKNLIGFTAEKDMELQESSFAIPNADLGKGKEVKSKSERFFPNMNTIEEESPLTSMQDDSSKERDKIKMQELEDDNRKLAKFLRKVRMKLKSVEEELQGYKENYGTA